jgi:hypothetical protein
MQIGMLAWKYSALNVKRPCPVSRKAAGVLTSRTFCRFLMAKAKGAFAAAA